MMPKDLSDKERTIVLITVLLTMIVGLALYAASAINKSGEELRERSESPEPAVTYTTP